MLLILSFSQNMRRIEANCLGHKEKFAGNYKSIEEVKAQVLEKYRKYLIKENGKETHIPFILTYKNKIGEKELMDINVIPESDGQWFQLHVKRVCQI